MPTIVAMRTAKTAGSKLSERLEAGEEALIACDGELVARLVASADSSRP